MVSIYDVLPSKLIEELAKELEKIPEMAPPSWAEFAKTGVSKERPPTQDNWWYLRAAAILRQVYKLGPIGVAKLRTKYSSRKNRGHKPDRTFKAGGNIIRKILQGLEKSGLIKQTEKGVHKGRVVTGAGKSLVDKAVVKVKEPFKKSKASEKAEKPKETKKAEKAEPKADDKKEEKPAKKSDDSVKKVAKETVKEESGKTETVKASEEEKQEKVE